MTACLETYQSVDYLINKALSTSPVALCSPSLSLDEEEIMNKSSALKVSLLRMKGGSAVQPDADCVRQADKNLVCFASNLHSVFSPWEIYIRFILCKRGNSVQPIFDVSLRLHFKKQQHPPPNA